MSEKNINIRLENRSDYSFPCRLWEAGEKCLTLSQFVPNLNGIIKQESCCMDSAIIHMDNHLQSQN